MRALNGGGLLGREIGVEGPVLLGAESLALLFALDDDPQRHRLHASGADAALDLLPEQRADLVADQPIEHAARLLGVKEIVIELARIVDCGLNGLFGDLVEQHAMNGGVGLAEPVGDVPRDRLALAVRVGREIDVLLILGGGLDCLR